MKNKNFGMILGSNANIICIAIDRRGLLIMTSTPNLRLIGVYHKKPHQIEFKIRVNGNYLWNIGCHK